MLKRSLLIFLGIFGLVYCLSLIQLPSLGILQPQPQVVDVFFVGGQSNAKAEMAEGIRDTLIASGRYPNLEVVQINHPGDGLPWWWGWDGNMVVDKSVNYLTDFFSGTGSGAALEDAINRIEAAGDRWRFSGFFWMQGETDAIVPAWAETYQERFKTIITALKADLGMTEDMVINLGLLHWTDQWNQVQKHGQFVMDNLPVIRSHLQALADNAATYGAIGMTTETNDIPRVDGVHLSRRGMPGFEDTYKALGERMAKVFLTNVSPSGES